MRGGVLAGEVVGVAGRNQRQAHPPGDVERALGAFLLDRARRCPGSRRRSSPRRRPSDTRRRAARPRPSCRGGCSRKTRPTRSPTGRSGLRRAVRGSPCRSAACNRSLPGTTATTAASGCGIPWRSWPAASDGRRAPGPIPRRRSVRSACRGDIGLHPDDRQDPGAPWPRGGTRRRRRGCRDRSRPRRACPAPWTVEPGPGSCSHRPEGCNGCGNEDARTAGWTSSSHLCCGGTGASCAARPTPWLRGDPNVPVAVHTR